MNDYIEIVPHDDNWNFKAKNEIFRLKQLLGISNIKHFGSTAIKDIKAKPIIDLIIGVENLSEAKNFVSILKADGYGYWSDNPKKDRMFFVKGNPDLGEKREFHVHIFTRDSFEYLVRPLFAKYLNKHENKKIEYQKLKEELSIKFKDNREAYTSAKDEFVKEINREIIRPLIHFEHIKEKHFPLMLKWLKEAHVKAHWDQNLEYDLAMVKEKYNTYIYDYKIDNGVKKEIHAYIIIIADIPIGYIQYYNAYDYSRENEIKLDDLPNSLATIDWFIGNIYFTGKNISHIILKLFLNKFIVNKYDACFVDPDMSNIAAIKSYKKAGFEEVRIVDNTIWMINIIR